MKPSFSYPGAIWINSEFSPKCYQLLLEFIGLTPEEDVLLRAEKQQYGTLIRFDDNQIGSNCFSYIIDNL